MTYEIERKFIVVNQQWKQMVNPAATEEIVQGYVRSPDSTVRVRISTNRQTRTKSAYLTLKSKREIADDVAILRREWEYPIPVAHAQDMLDTLCDSKIAKVRHHLVHEGKEWTIDEFLKPKFQGLVIAEIEMPSATTAFAFPPFITAASEVTKDERYTNRYLADHNKEQLEFLKKAIKKAVESGQVGK